MNKFAPEVRDRALQMVFDLERGHASRWAAVMSIPAKIGYVPQTLHEWVTSAGVNSDKRANVLAEVGEGADKVKALEREVPELGRPGSFT